MKYGTIIRSIMREKEITARALAKKLEMHEAYLSKILNDKQSFGLKNLVKFADILECSSDRILGRLPGIDNKKSED